MSEGQPRDEGGEFNEKVTDQDILKVFDTTREPFLTAREVAEEVALTTDGARRRLERMREKDLVDKKKAGARAVGWWAKVAPRLSDESRQRVEESKDRGEFVSLGDG